MFLPIGDAPNPRATPWVTYTLIALNVAVFLLVTLPRSGAAADPNDPLFREYADALAALVGRALTPLELASNVTAYDLTVYRHGFRPAEPSVLAWLTSMFLHAGVMHLVGNMLFLWIYGNNVEHRLGRLGYLAAYLGTGAAATLAHAVFNADSNVPTVGASGAISGVLGFYFVFFPRNEVRILILLIPWFVRVFELPARLVLGAYLVLDNLLPVFLQGRGDGSGVAYGAHIGGFVGGLAVALFLNRRERTAVPREYRGLEARTTDDRSAAEEISEALRSGDDERAAGLLFRGGPSVERMVPTEDLLVLAKHLGERGHPGAALTLYRRVLARRPDPSLAAEAHAGAAEVEARALGRTPSAFQDFFQAVRAAPQSDAAARARASLGRIAAAQRPPMDDRRWQ